jgi:predicted transcriptional regulator
MAKTAAGRVALMAIHPRFAYAILDGTKQVEFRKRRVAPDITRVLIYATSPVQKVVGSFTISEIVVDAPDLIWDEFGEFGVIERDAFAEYYATSDAAVAIRVEGTERFERPLALSELEPSPSIPQSFSYLPTSVLK